MLNKFKKIMLVVMLLIFTTFLVGCDNDYHDSSSSYDYDSSSSSNYDSSSSYDYDSSSSYDYDNSSSYDYDSSSSSDYDNSSSYDYDSSSSSGYDSSSSYDYDKGYGYTAPEEGESLSDYIKRQDPELYDSMTDIYESLE